MEDSNIWKAFVSPKAVYHLCLKMSDMRLYATKSLELDEDSHHLSRVTEAEHEAIQQDFLSSLTDAQRAAIDARTEQDSSYSAFVAALRLNGLSKLWGSYRRDAYKRLLEERLEQIPIAEEMIPPVVNQLMASQLALFKAEEAKSLQPQLPSIVHTNGDLAPRVHGSADAARLRAAVQKSATVVA